MEIEMTVQVIEQIEDVLDGSWQDTVLSPEGITEIVITNDNGGSGGSGYC
ncbi:hypothetical protein ABZX92_39455 [Lentzea sp. NPDC006480]